VEVDLLGRWLSGHLRRWLELDSDRARVLELECRLEQLTDGHELFARDAAAHLAALQSECERFRGLLATQSAAHQTLLAQHEALRAASAAQHEALRAASAAEHEALRAAFTAQHEALRAASAALEDAISDIEQAQTSVAVKLAGDPKVPE
jgi:hypothetical protein